MKVDWSHESCFLLDKEDGWECVHQLTGEEMECTSGKKWAGSGSVMVYPMFCCETLGPALHLDVTLTHTTLLKIADTMANATTMTSD